MYDVANQICHSLAHVHDSLILFLIFFEILHNQMGRIREIFYKTRSRLPESNVQNGIIITQKFEKKKKLFRTFLGRVLRNTSMCSISRRLFSAPLTIKRSLDEYLLLQSKSKFT